MVSGMNYFSYETNFNVRANKNNMKLLNTSIIGYGVVSDENDSIVRSLCCEQQVSVLFQNPQFLDLLF